MKIYYELLGAKSFSSFQAQDWERLISVFAKCSNHQTVKHSTFVKMFGLLQGFLLCKHNKILLEAFEHHFLVLPILGDDYEGNIKERCFV